MKVLCVTSKGYPIRGGAEITNIAFLKKLSEKFGYKCHIYSFFPIKKRLLYGDVQLNTFRDIHELKVMIREFRPEVIISYMDVSPYVVKMSKQFNVPVIFYMPHPYSQP